MNTILKKAERVFKIIMSITDQERHPFQLVHIKYKNQRLTS